MAVDVSPDGRYVAAAIEYGRKVIVWSTADGRRHMEYTASNWPIESVLIFDAQSKGLWSAGSQDHYLTYHPLKP